MIPASPVAVPPLLPAPASRSRFVTITAWILMVGSALVLPVSVISLLMVLAGSHGTQEASFFGGLAVIGGPPAGVLAGFGLWRRWRWAHAAVLVLMLVVASGSIATIVRGPTPERRYVSPAGVPTTVLASSVNYPFHALVIVASLATCAGLSRPAVRAEFGHAVRRRRATTSRPAGEFGRAGFQAPVESRQSNEWRVGHQGRDEMYYEERRDGAWQRLRISGEMLMGRAHHVIYFASAQAWQQQYPAWARDRRDEIIARIKSEFRAPDYEYQGDVSSGTLVPSETANHLPLRATPVLPPDLLSTPRKKGLAATPAQMRALWIAIAIMFGLGAGAGWLVVRGLTHGDTWIPAKRISRQRQVQRAEEPGLFWLSVAVYGAVAAGTFGLGAWGTREAMRLRRSPSRH